MNSPKKLIQIGVVYQFYISFTGINACTVSKVSIGYEDCPKNRGFCTWSQPTSTVTFESLNHLSDSIGIDGFIPERVLALDEANFTFANGDDINTPIS